MSNEIFVTPAGKANYCWLSRPDTTYNKLGGTFSTNLILSKKEAKVDCERIKEAHEEAQIEYKKVNKSKKEAKLPYKINDDGDVEFKFSQKSIITNSKTGEQFKKTVAILDSKNRPVKVNVGAGTTMKVAYEIASYYHPQNGAGVTLRLKGVRIIDLVEYTGGGANYFGEEEDGFEASEEDQISEANWDDDSKEEEQEENNGEESNEDIPF